MNECQCSSSTDCKTGDCSGGVCVSICNTVGCYCDDGTDCASSVCMSNACQSSSASMYQSGQYINTCECTLDT